MDIVIITFRLLAASQIVFFVFALVGSENPRRIRAVGICLVLGIFSYLCAPLAVDYFGLIAGTPVILMASIIPSLLLLFVWVVFEEHRRIPVWIIVLLVADIVAECISIAMYLSELRHPTIALWMQAWKMILVFVALYLLWNGRDSDLVEKRLQLRWVFIWAVSISVLAVVSIELLTSFHVPKLVEALGMAAIFATALLVNLSFLRHNPTLRLIGAEAHIKDKSSDSEITALLQRMKSERLYADHDLRVSTLAALLGLPEYQLRRKINSQLGYRNFNQFVNRFRIEEAAARLLEESRTPILTIALDVGFRSISSFNTAFQGHFGVTPSTYRSNSS